MNASGTVFSLNKNDAPYRIKYLAEHGEDPGDRNPSVDNDSPEIWEERLKEYLNHLRAIGGPSQLAQSATTTGAFFGRWIAHALAHGQSPVVFDPPYWKGSWMTKGTFARARAKAIPPTSSGGASIGTVPDPGFSRSTDTRSLQERLEGCRRGAVV